MPPNPRSRLAAALTSLVALCLSSAASSADLSAVEANPLDGAVVLAYSNQLEILSSPSSSVQMSSSVVTLPNLKTIVALTSGGDAAGETLFLTDFLPSGTSVYKVDLRNPENATKIIGDASLHLVQGIAVNSERNHIFLTDSKARKLVRYSLKDDTVGDEVTLLQFEGSDKPKGLAFDHCQMKLYFTRWNQENASIERISPDGTSRELVISTLLHQPRGLSIDPWERLLYWIDVDDRDRFRLERSALDGSGRTLLCQGQGNAPVDMVVDERYVYWTDGRNMAVWRVDKHAAECQPQVVRRLKSTRPMGLAVLGRSGGHDCNAAHHPEFEVSVSIPKIATWSSASQEEDACFNFCINGNCSMTSIGIPMCFCQPGFAGDRCEVDRCENFCMRGGRCSISELHEPVCACPEGVFGVRCQGEQGFVTSGAARMESDVSSSTVLVSCLTALVCLVLVCASVIVLLFLKITTMRKSGNVPIPTIVRKRNPPSFSGSGVIAAKPEAKQQSNPFSSSACRGSAEGVVFDLEDCCHMVLCDKPCVAASFRKPTHRKNHRSPTKKSFSPVDEELLLENEVLSVGREESGADHLCIA